ncbi:MAG: hypothetical protein R3D86_10855 [Emcibacteraceae bacterium]
MSEQVTQISRTITILSKTFKLTNDNIATLSSILLLFFGLVILTLLFLYPMFFSITGISPTEFSWVTVFLNLGFLLVICAFSGFYGALTVIKTVSSDEGKYVRTEVAVSKAVKQSIPLTILLIITGLIVALGLTIFIIPGIIFITMFYVIVPIKIIEKTTIRETLVRSRELTKGRRSSILAVIFISTLAYAICSVILNFLGSPGYLKLLLLGYYIIFSFVLYTITYLEIGKELETYKANI